MGMRNVAAILVATSAFVVVPAMIETASAAGDRTHKVHKVRKDRTIKGAPGPMAGAGLSFMVLAGGYVAYLRRKRTSSPNTEKTSTHRL